MLIHRGGRGQSFVYELLYEGQGDEGGRFLLGLIDAGKLSNDANRGGSEGDRGSENTDRGMPGAAQGHPKGGPSATAQNATSPNSEGPLLHLPPETDENARLRHLSENSNRKAS